MVTGRARSQSRPVRRLSTRVPGVDRFDFSGPSRWNTASASIASESNQWRQTHSWTSPWESIQRAVARSLVPQECKNFFQHAGYVRDRTRSNCAFLAAKSLSIWLSLGGMDGN